MLQILYGMVCHENFVRDEVCCIVKKVENHWSNLINNVLSKYLYHKVFDEIFKL